MHFSVFVPLLFALGAVAEDKLVGRLFPHLIVPVVQDQPHVAKGTQFEGLVETHKGGHQVYTEILFDVPVNDANYCKVNFAISTDPPAPWSLQGNITDRGHVLLNVSVLEDVPGVNDTWSSKPMIGEWVATIGVTHEGDVKVEGGEVPCAKATTAQFIVYPGTTGDLHFTWYELDNPAHGIYYDMIKMQDGDEEYTMVEEEDADA